MLFERTGALEEVGSCVGAGAGGELACGAAAGIAPLGRRPGEAAGIEALARAAGIEALGRAADGGDALGRAEGGEDGVARGGATLGRDGGKLER